jgi:hypothetical protein
LPGELKAESLCGAGTQSPVGECAEVSCHHPRITIENTGVRRTLWSLAVDGGEKEAILAGRMGPCGYAMDFFSAFRSRTASRPAQHTWCGCRTATLVALRQLHDLTVTRENCGSECEHQIIFPKCSWESRKILWKLSALVYMLSVALSCDVLSVASPRSRILQRGSWHPSGLPRARGLETDLSVGDVQCL